MILAQLHLLRFTSLKTEILVFFVLSLLAEHKSCNLDSNIYAIHTLYRAVCVRKSSVVHFCLSIRALD